MQKNGNDANGHALIRVIWITDVSGWAYDNRAKTISDNLDDYAHAIIISCEVAETDIVVCCDPRILSFIAKPAAKIVLNLNAIKLFI